MSTPTPRRPHRVHLALTAEERALLDRAAARCGLGITVYARAAVLAAARAEVETVSPRLPTATHPKFEL